MKASSPGFARPALARLHHIQYFFLSITRHFSLIVANNFISCVSLQKWTAVFKNACIIHAMQTALLNCFLPSFTFSARSSAPKGFLWRNTSLYRYIGMQVSFNSQKRNETRKLTSEEERAARKLSQRRPRQRAHSGLKRHEIDAFNS